jgi:hypothetical protein
VKEAIEIRLHPDNFNRDEGLNISHTWRPVSNMLQRSRGAPVGKKDIYKGVSKSFRTESITKYTLTTINIEKQHKGLWRQNSLD